MNTFRFVVECTGWAVWGMGAILLLIGGGYIVTLAVLEYIVRWFKLGALVISVGYAIRERKAALRAVAGDEGGGE